jgi:hypothetical protein
VFGSYFKVISREYQDRSHLTKSNKISKVKINIIIHVASKFDIDSSSYVSGGGLRTCW